MRVRVQDGLLFFVPVIYDWVFDTSFTRQGMSFPHLKWNYCLYFWDLLNVSMHETGVESNLPVERNFLSLIALHLLAINIVLSKEKTAFLSFTSRWCSCPTAFELLSKSHNTWIAVQVLYLVEETSRSMGSVLGDFLLADIPDHWTLGEVVTFALRSWCYWTQIPSKVK